MWGGGHPCEPVLFLTSSECVPATWPKRRVRIDRTRSKVLDDDDASLHSCLKPIIYFDKFVRVSMFLFFYIKNEGAINLRLIKSSQKRITNHTV